VPSFPLQQGFLGASLTGSSIKLFSFFFLMIYGLASIKIFSNKTFFSIQNKLPSPFIKNFLMMFFATNFDVS
jgi:hypothetical protein